MHLALQITSSQAAVMGPNASKIFGERGGTIGRTDGNDWVLPDDQRYISRRHAIIRCMNGMFSLEDVSAGGTLINGEIGAGGEPVILRSGDQIQIGDYLIFASVVEGDSDAIPAPTAPSQHIDPAKIPPPGIPEMTTSPGYAPGSSTIGPIDPLDMFEAAPPAPPPAAPAAFSDHSPAMSDHFNPPGAPADGGAIPDNWDLTDFSPAKSTSPPPAVGMPPPSPTPAETGIAPGMSATAEAIPIGSGPGNALLDQLMPMIVQGMMEVLQSRAEVKSQFRLALTTIKPVENNPLKFSPNVDDAMNHLFYSTTPGYLNPAQAFEEGFKDIKAHQLAMIAGMRAAFEHMLSQFSPKVLEDNFEGGAKRGKFMGMANKVRYWDLYREMFDRMTRDSDDNFRKLFGEEFASAYEEQMHKIKTRT